MSPNSKPNPWNAFLESLHSALIDELIERHPEPKPELGLPLRQNRFAIPATEVEQLLLTEVSFDSSKGVALLASPQTFTKALGCNHGKLWQAMVKRAGSEFARRQIQPKFAAIQEFKATDAFPPSTLHCARVIWIPLKIPAGSCYFGVGV
jgi:hypothetical protein